MKTEVNDALVKQIQHRVPTLDADESVFFARQLEHIKQLVFEVLYTPIKARQLFPMNSEADPADRTFTYRQFDKLGMTKLIADHASDLPRIDVSAKEFTSSIRSLGNYIAWSLNEIRASAKANTNLDQKLANASRESAMREENRLAWFGDTATGIPGFLTNPNISTVVLPADGTGATTDWKNKTADQILRDLNLIANQPVTISKGVEFANVMLMPIEQFTLISTIRVPGREITVLEFFLRSHPTIDSVEWVEDLVAAGAGDTDVAVAYNRSPDKLEMIVPQDFEMLPPQEVGLETKVFTHQRFGGVVIYRPLSISKAIGI